MNLCDWKFYKMRISQNLQMSKIYMCEILKNFLNFKVWKFVNSQNLPMSKIYIIEKCSKIFFNFQTWEKILNYKDWEFANLQINKSYKMSNTCKICKITKFLKFEYVIKRLCTHLHVLYTIPNLQSLMNWKLNKVREKYKIYKNTKFIRFAN